VNCGAMTIHQIVERKNLVTLLDELFRNYTTDVTGSPSDQNSHTE
jgi:hypothetical protein